MATSVPTSRSRTLDHGIPGGARVARGEALSAALYALGALVLSYAVGLFGWMEAGLRTPIAIAIAAEVGAAVVLGAALAATSLPIGSEDR